MDIIKSTVFFTKKNLKSILPPQRKKKISQCQLLPSKQPIYITPEIKTTWPAVDEVDSTTPKKYTQVLSLLPVYLLQLCYGMNTGFPAILNPQLGEPCSEFQISEDQESWIVSLDNLLTPIICISSGFLQHKLGPLKVLMFSCLPYTLGWITAAAARNVYHLYISRILVGISHAILSTTVYTVEMSSRNMRGTFSMLESVLRCTGCLLVYSLGLYFRWWQIACFAPFVPVLAFFCCLYSPESPVFLVSRGRLKEAEQKVRKLYGEDYDSHQEVSIMNKDLISQRESCSEKKEYFRKLHKHPEIYKPLMIIIFLSILQQFSGVSIIRAYVIKIFGDIFNTMSDHDSLFEIQSVTNGTVNSELCGGDLVTSRMAYLSAIIIGVCRLISSLSLAKLLQKYRRRVMYFISTILTIICLFSFSITHYYSIHTTDIVSSSAFYLQILKWSNLIIACLLVFSVQLGVQTLPLLLSGELFPSDVRATCKGLTRAVTCIFMILSFKLYPVLEQNISLFGTFGVFGVILLIFSPVVYFILPETKDLGLEIIHNYFTPSHTTWYLTVEEIT